MILKVSGSDLVFLMKATGMESTADKERKSLSGAMSLLLPESFIPTRSRSNRSGKNICEPGSCGMPLGEGATIHHLRWCVALCRGRPADSR